MRIKRDVLLVWAVSASLISCTGLLAFSPLLASAHQQQEQRSATPETIKVRVRLIPVDVIVTDKSDRPVVDLRKEDFTILEDGRPQEIRHFQLQELTSSPTSADQHLFLRKVPTLELAPQPSRTFLILLGRGRHQRNFRCVDALIRFVRNDLLPQDRVGVFAYNRATDFTADHEQIARILERYAVTNEKIERWCELNFKGTAAIYGKKEIPTPWQNEIDRIFEVPGGGGFRRVPPEGLSEAERRLSEESIEVAETLLYREGKQMLWKGFDAIHRAQKDYKKVDALTDLTFDEYASTFATTSQDVRNMFTAIEYMRYLEGEKHLLFFTENGIFLPRSGYDKDIAAVANDARVAIDTFQTGGVFAGRSVYDPGEYTRMDPETGLHALGSPTSSSLGLPRADLGLSFSRTFALGSLSNVSELTGGLSSIHSDIAKALTRVNEVTRAEYLLGYYPKETEWDGKYRSIIVKVNRSGVKISYRHGYYARDAIRPYNRQDSLSYSRISAAAGYESEVKDIPFKVSTSRQRDSSGMLQFRVDLNIDASKVRFNAAGGLHSGRLEIVVFYVDPQDKLLGNDWQILEMDLKEETYRDALRRGIAYSTSIPVRYNVNALKIVVYDHGGDKVGSAVKQIR